MHSSLASGQTEHRRAYGTRFVDPVVGGSVELVLRKCMESMRLMNSGFALALVWM